MTGWIQSHSQLFMLGIIALAAIFTDQVSSKMLQLSSDPTYHYEILRTIAATATRGSDISEILQICPNIEPGDFESWYTQWNSLAERVLDSAENATNQQYYDSVSLRDVYLRASHYYFVSDFFLHGKPDDPRINETHKQWVTYFDKANALSAVSGQRMNLPAADGSFSVPVIIYQAPAAVANGATAPTIILGNGFDGSMEEMHHVLGLFALERGYNVVLYEGPGQPTVRREQNAGFIYDWERVVTPVVDHLFTLDVVDKSKISLFGYSLGGYLAARAAAFEHRLASCVAIGGVWDYGTTLRQVYPISMKVYDDGGNETAFNDAFAVEASNNTNVRWIRDQLTWSFNKQSPYQAVKTSLQMTMMNGIAEQIQCPFFVGDATSDQFFAGQPKLIADAVGENATLVTFDQTYAADTHCEVGANFYLAQVVFAWLNENGIGTSSR